MIQRRAHRWRALALGVSLIGLSVPAVAEGGPPAGAPAISSNAPDPSALQRAQRMLLERAKQRYEAGRNAGQDSRPHLEAALDALHLAYQLDPSPWLLFNIAQVQSRLGACRNAADLYQRFLASNPAPDARASAEAALALLGSCESANDASPADDGLAPGLFMPTSSASIFTARSGVALALVPPELPVEQPNEGSVVRALPWALGSLSVVAGVASAVCFGDAKAAERDLDRIRVAGPKIAETQQRGESALDLSRLFGGFAVGFALAAGASYLWLRPEASEASVASRVLERLSWLPLDGGGGAVYQSAF